MTVYEIKTQGEIDWICYGADDILGAIQWYVKETDSLLEDIDSIILLPEKEWETIKLVLEDEEGTVTNIAEYMKDQVHNEVIASTVY